MTEEEVYFPSKVRLNRFVIVRKHPLLLDQSFLLNSSSYSEPEYRNETEIGRETGGRDPESKECLNPQSYLSRRQQKIEAQRD